MSEFRPDLDVRTCSVCGDPVAEHLKGFMDSLRACGFHLDEWKASDARRNATLAAIRSNRPIGHEAFEKWAADRRARMQAMEET